ncbi:chromate transporter [Paenibacillus ehimensis]|uniref:chromate transporter n=1 Tax=Paenibacillus ehimensis TaxID=79264 RepID=UPI003D2CC673
MKSWMRKLRPLGPIFWTFCKISPVTFGGGYAMIPVMEREVIGKRRWIEPGEMSGVLSIAGSAPGGVGVNAAAFIGYRLAGVPGAAVAVGGMTLPAFLIVFLLSLVFREIYDLPKVAAAFQGIQAAIAALIIISAYNMGKSSIVDRTTLATAAFTVVLLLVFHVHPMLVILIGLVIGHLLVRMKRKLGYRAFEPKDEEPPAAGNGYKYADYFIADGI